MPEEACYADDIGDYRWEHFTLAEKHEWMQTGEGAAAVRPAIEALRNLSERLARSDRELRAELRALGVTWAGTASDAATSATDRLAEWVGGVGRTTSAGQGNVDTYGSSFAEMKPKIPPPVNVEKGSFGHMVDAASGGYAALVGLQTEYSRQVEAQHAAEQQANAALDAHREATRHALKTFPVAEAPPEPGSGSGTATAAASSSPGWAPGPPPAPPAPVDGRPGLPSPAAAHHPGTTTSATAGATASGTTSASAGDRPAVPPPDARAPGVPPAAPVGAVPVGPVAGAAGTGPAPAGSRPARGYRPPVITPAPGPGGGAGPAGYRGDPAPPPRTGTGNPAGTPGPAAERAPHRAPFASGVPGAPLGMGGVAGGSGGAERYHRNQTFIPSDEPFHVEFADVSPPVLGVRVEDEP